MPVSPKDVVFVADLLRKDLQAPHKARLAMICKAQGLPADADPQHTYSHRLGSYGDYTYHYKDPLGNYWKYTNAPGDSTHHDPVKGEPMISEDQPMPHTAPEFFTTTGYKRHMAVPTGSAVQENPAYNPDDPSNLWFEKFKHPVTGQEHFTYLDKDIKENPDLYVQHQLRLVDAGMLKYRMLANKLYLSGHQRDVCLGVLMFLMDQAFFDLEELRTATVGDLTFVGTTVILGERKFTCDYQLYYTLTKLVSGRESSQPLLFQQTAQGLRPLGKFLLNAIFNQLGFRPQFLKYWHATQLYSTIIHRLVETGHEADLDKEALRELSAYMHTTQDVVHLVDPKVRDTIVQMTSGSSMLKSLVADKYGVPYVRTDLVERTPDEQAFSVWLHSAPMHLETAESSMSTSEPSEPNKDVPPVEDPIAKSVLFGVAHVTAQTTRLPSMFEGVRVCLFSPTDMTAQHVVKQIQAEAKGPLTLVGVATDKPADTLKSLTKDGVPALFLSSDLSAANTVQSHFTADLLLKSQVSLSFAHFSSFLSTDSDVRILSLNSKEVYA